MASGDLVCGFYGGGYVNEFVYFITYDGGPIKIGRAKNVVSRLKQLQTSLPHKLEVMGVLCGGHQVETELHTKFAAYRMTGEWFERHHQLTDYIEQFSEPLGDAVLKSEKCQGCVRLEEEVQALKYNSRQKESQKEKVACDLYIKKFSEDMIRYVSSVMAGFIYRLVSLNHLMKDIEERGDVFFSDEVHRNFRRVADDVFGFPATQWTRTQHYLAKAINGELKYPEIDRLAVEFLTARFRHRTSEGFPILTTLESRLRSLQKSEVAIEPKDGQAS